MYIKYKLKKIVNLRKPPEDQCKKQLMVINFRRKVKTSSLQESPNFPRVSLVSQQ